MNPDRFTQMMKPYRLKGFTDEQSGITINEAIRLLRREHAAVVRAVKTLPCRFVAPGLPILCSKNNTNCAVNRRDLLALLAARKTGTI
jgi:hypothetical protein